ncbi:hypothetical protein H2201_008572 [Coniosporium apollinis]|uniref:Major facilitator superfamily (MFS) profile domain-containing protein n=1 Tax=Coniosporium apollinis TaxID=61459 RepID=A0ABQ9NMI6_9PEZI|nr:hypothetical protein H2201_008572 [Coniosporium apollinis]
MSRTQRGLLSHSTASSSSSSKDSPEADDYKSIELNDLTSSSRSSQDSSVGRQSNANSEAVHLLANPPPDTDSAVLPISTPEHPPKEPPVTWRSLPRKDQLIILTLARLAEPLTQTSLQAYMYYQLQSFDPSLSSSTISSQAGILQGAFTFAQFLTAIMWGRIADSEWAGRKTVLLVGLVGTAVSAVGFGFSKSFGAATFWRSLGGALNGNVGVMRTMISEIIREKKYVHGVSAFVAKSTGGPIMGGLLADPVTSYPSIFGPGSLLGGKEGIHWMIKWPYALPNLASALFLTVSSSMVILGLEETLDARRDKPDYGLRFGRYLRRLISRRRNSHQYATVPDEDENTLTNTPTDIELQPSSSTPPKPRTPKPAPNVPLRRIFTHNVLTTLLSHGLLAMHVGTFNNLWFVFLSTPRFDASHPSPPSHTTQSLPFAFTGGLALPPRQIGLALAILGIIGITLQLLLYPAVSARLSTVTTYRFSLLLFPVAYTIAPFLALIPSTAPPPAAAAGVPIWASIALVLLFQTAARTFALPATTVLVNNCCPDPRVLGTVHGIAQSVSSGTRTLGPVIFLALFGLGIKIGRVWLAWWALAVLAIVGAVAGRFVREGSGREDEGKG